MLLLGIIMEKPLEILYLEHWIRQVLQLLEFHSQKISLPFTSKAFLLEIVAVTDMHVGFPNTYT